MTRQYEVLDTINTGKIPGECMQNFTNAEGKIFLLGDTGKVYCFDPFGEKKVETLHDLRKD